MSSDETLLEEMQKLPEDPRRVKKAEPKYAQSKFTKETLAEKTGDKVWVKCVSELGPWANDTQMKFWEDYFVNIEEAIMLDERRFCVILEEPLNK